MTMTKLDITAVRARLGSINPRRMQDIRALSEAAFKLLSIDLPAIISELYGHLPDKPAEVVHDGPRIEYKN